MVVVDEAELHRLPGWIAVYRAASAMGVGDVPATVKYAQRALDLVAEDDALGRGAAGALLGLATWASGDLEAAHRMYAEGMASVARAGHLADTIGAAVVLADIRIAQGRLHAAMRTYQQGLQLATAQGTAVVRGAADMHVGISELCLERNALDEAMQHLRRSQELGELAGLPKNAGRRRVVMARIRQAEGDLDGALALLDEAEGRFVADYSPNVRPIAAMKARVWVVQGRLEEALGWARAQGLSVEDELGYLREFEHITLARVLLARGRARPGAGMRFLERLLLAAEAGGRMGSVIEILGLQALAYQAQGDIAAARRLLQQALALAEPEGYIRLFVDEGPPMQQLIAECRMQGTGWTAQLRAYADRLLAAFEPREETTDLQTTTDLRVATPVLPLAHGAGSTLVEPLSERELEVLRLLASELSGPQIARRLMVSLSTLRTHTQNIYGKLGVNNRQAAVRRAQELGLEL